MTLDHTSLSRATNIAGFVLPFIRYWLRAHVTPVLAGYKITHTCNLSCRHCPYWKRSGKDQGFNDTIGTLRRLQEMGVRIVIFEGGEPLLWRDGTKSFTDVLLGARELFGSVCVTTNGTIPWTHLPIDRTWVSVDGPRHIHDAIRGEGVFDRLWFNLTKEGHGSTFVSTTINTVNMHAMRELMSLLRGVVAGVTIQFHYPYDGLPDPLFVAHQERALVLKELIRLKGQGYPVANSFQSLRELEKQRWTCEDRLLANVEPDGTITQGCYLKNRGKADCSLCGFSAHNEMSLAFRGSIPAVFTGMKIFFGNTSRVPLPSTRDSV